MNKQLLIISILLFGASAIMAQSNKDSGTKGQEGAPYSIHEYNVNHEFIFDGNVPVTQCGPSGENLDTVKRDARQGNTFNIKSVVPATGDVVIQFVPFKFEPEKNTFNGKYFLVKRSDFKNTCSDNTNVSKWKISFGTMIIPFKFRPTKSIFTSNLNLGSSVYFQYPISADWSNGGVIGLSLSSVTLDSLSTKGKVRTNTDRPALTPTLSYVISYKNISFTAGLGVDYINRTSIVEKSWTFAGKPWIGFGIGINLFSTSNTNVSNTPASKNQEKDGTSGSPPAKKE